MPRARVSILFSLPALVIMSTLLAAQDAQLAFEVASVRPNTSGEGFVRFQRQPGGRFSATNVPLRELIRFAYQVQNFQMEGIPGWAASERFDVVAKAEGDPPPSPPGGPPDPMILMMRTLLADRFKLEVHNDTREMPIYALVAARADGKAGEKLVPSTVDCAAVMAARGRGAGPPPGLPPPLPQRPMCGLRIGPGVLGAGGIPLTQFANALSQMVGRQVIDKTGLAGNYEIDLTWTPDQLPQGTPPPGAPAFPPIDPNGPSIFTAVQEQLGLKLESTRGAVQVLVIDHVERPTPD